MWRGGQALQSLGCMIPLMWGRFRDAVKIEFDRVLLSPRNIEIDAFTKYVLQ